MKWRADSVQVDVLRRGEQPATGGAPPVLILSCASEAWAKAHGGSHTLSFSRGPAQADAVASLYVREMLHEDDCEVLPGLDHHDGRQLQPSVVRDAARLALQNTGTPVEVALVVSDGLAPWQLASLDHRPELIYTLRRYLEQRPGAVVVLPDASGPVSIAPAGARSGRMGSLASASLPERWRGLAHNLSGLAALFREHYQIGLCDAPVSTGAVLGSEQGLEALAGMDVGVCTWAGVSQQLDAHGWRSAAALVGAALAKSISDLSMNSNMTVPVLSHHSIVLGSGRLVKRSRLMQGRATGGHQRPQTAHCTVVSLGHDQHAPEILQDASMRRPLGDWTLPALWTVKQVIRRVETIASAYVFATADEAMAIDLKGALFEELGQLIGSGVLVAPTGEGLPLVETTVGDGSSHAGAAPSPRLEATITAALAPWLTRLELQVEIDQQVQLRAS